MGEREPRKLPSNGGVTARVVVLALLILVALSYLGFYFDVLYASAGDFNAGVPASAPFTVLFLLAALGVWRPLRLRGLTRQELLAVFVIVLTGAPVVSYGILAYLLPHQIFWQYGAATHPEWRATFMQIIPAWFSPTDPRAVEEFFVGGGRVPWHLWMVPLSAWCSFLLALVIASSCLALLVQRQWITNERLSFPIAQIPLELTVEPQGSSGKAGRLPLASVFWIGFTISFAIPFWNNLTSVFPSLPTIPLGPVPLIAPATTGPTAAFGEMDLVLWPWLIAIAYLIPKELSFSCWFFWLARVMLAFIAIVAGAPPRSPEGWLGDTAFPAFAFQGFGAILALSVWAVYRARRHLGLAFRIAFSRASGQADGAEPLPYRWLLIAFALSYGWMVYFCYLIGARLWVGAGLIGLILMFYMMWTWLRAETGLGLLLFPLFIDDMTDAMGNAIFRPQEIVAIMGLRWTYFPGAGSTAQVISGNVLDSMKIADSARLNSRRLVFAMVGGLVLSLVLGVYVMLTGMYQYGFYGLRGSMTSWLGSQVNWGAGHVFYAISTPSRFDGRGLAGMLAGAAVAIALGMLRLRFWWWPLHPVGFLAANSWGMQWFYMPFFVGWLAKALVTRYGGLQLYRQTIPLAVGLVAGDLLNQVVWAFWRAALRGAPV
jgi:hypothetical protein